MEKKLTMVEFLLWLSGLRARLVSMRMWVPSLALLSGKGSGIAVSCGVGHRCGSDSTLLWLWRRPAAVAPIRPLAWEPPYAAGMALKRQKDKTKKELPGEFLKRIMKELSDILKYIINCNK